MISGPNDILRNIVQENPIWVEAVENLEMAKRRVVELVARAPGQYLVFCQRTGRFVSTITGYCRCRTAIEQLLVRAGDAFLRQFRLRRTRPRESRALSVAHGQMQ